MGKDKKKKDALKATAAMEEAEESPSKHGEADHDKSNDVMDSSNGSDGIEPVSIPYADQDFRGWSDVTNPNPKKIRLPAEEDEGLDLNGNTFGMLPQSLVASFSDSVMAFADSDVSERVSADSESQLLQVKMS